MTTLIAVYNSGGCVGRCDARCYGAVLKKCNCICGGKNHGAGKAKAEQNVAELVGLTTQDLIQFADHRGFNCDAITAINRIAEPNARHARVHAYMKLKQYDMFAEEGV